MDSVYIAIESITTVPTISPYLRGEVSLITFKCKDLGHLVSRFRGNVDKITVLPG